MSKLCWEIAGERAVHDLKLLVMDAFSLVFGRIYSSVCKESGQLICRNYWKYWLFLQSIF